MLDGLDDRHRLDGSDNWCRLDGLNDWCRLDGLDGWCRLDGLDRWCRLDGLDDWYRLGGRANSHTSCTLARRSRSLKQPWYFGKIAEIVDASVVKARLRRSLMLLS